MMPLNFYFFLHILGFVVPSHTGYGSGYLGVSECDQMKLEKCLHDWAYLCLLLCPGLENMPRFTCERMRTKDILDPPARPPHR